jgi:predicted SprT family Zn-dependent metalloprotease
VQRTKVIDSALNESEHYENVNDPGQSTMRHQSAVPPSSLPSLMMPCPVCAGRMVYQTRRPITSEVEDTVYACRSCGAELIRTTVYRASETKDIKSAEAA